MNESQARAFARGVAEAEQSQRGSAREQIVTAVDEKGVVLWQDSSGTAYATVPRGDGFQRFLVRSDAFRHFVVLTYGDANSVKTRSGGSRPGVPPQQALAEAMLQFQALALRGEVRTPSPRLWRAADGTIWLDLGRPDWSLVRVTAEGWSVMDSADVPLIRPSGMLPLPLPIRTDDAVRRFEELLNVRGRNFKLVAAFAVKALYPQGANPVLAVDGEQGSGKTTTTRMIRRVTDPNLADLRPLPKSQRDLLIAASNGRIVAYDNVSSLSPDMADAICRLSTGTGFGERQLFSNTGEVVGYVCNPVLLNGIPSLLARGDLADRAVAVMLPPIPDDQRRSETQIWSNFEQAAPGILALLLDALVLAVRDAAEIQLPSLPRMADFAQVACAAAPAFGWTQEEMLAALEDNRAEAVVAVIEADAVAAAVQAIAMEKGPWNSTAAELLIEINNRAPLECQRERDWPKDATRLSGRLKRVAPALRRAGVELEFSARTAAARMISIRQHSKPTASSASSASSAPEAPDAPHDAVTLNDADDADEEVF